MKIEYLEFDLDDIFGYFARGLELPTDCYLHDFEVICDQRTGRVIFKVYIQTKN